MNGSLDSAGMLEAPPAGSEEPGKRLGGSGYALPSPPPPPHMSRKALQESIRQGKRELRTTTFRSVVVWLSTRHRVWWWFFGGLAMLFAAALFALWFTESMVRVARAPQAAPTTATSIVYRRSMPNPLEQVKLTPEAAVILGAHDSDGDGKMDALDDAKSSDALVTILNATDLCAWFVTVDKAFEPVLSQTVTPGAVKLATCADPIAPATTVPPTTTTAAVQRP